MKKFLGLFVAVAIFLSLVSCGKTYTVSFETNGGNTITAVETEDGKITAPTDPTKDGYTFNGWYLDSELKNKFDFNTEIEADTTLYASWTALPTYTVKFDSKGGSAVADVTTDFNGKLTAPKNPVKDYYEFAGWYDNEACTGEAIKLADKAFTANTTLYAKWELIEVMDYENFMAAEAGDFVAIEGYVSAKQSWWADKATMYLAGENAGEGYFIYEMTMTEAEYNNDYKIGAKVRIYGAKTIYAGEHEIMGKDINYDLSTVETAKASNHIVDITSSVKADDIEKYQNSKFTATLKVKQYPAQAEGSNTTVAANGAYAYKGSEPTDDLYFILVDAAGNELSCCVEKYLTSAYATVKEALMSADFTVGELVEVEGYLYWWEGANPHITSIRFGELDAMYETFMSTEDGEEVEVEGYLLGKTTYYNGKCNLYLAGATAEGYTTKFVENGAEGYYVYDFECTQEQFDALTYMCFVNVKGTKALYAGMQEIINATVTKVSAPLNIGFSALEVADFTLVNEDTIAAMISLEGKIVEYTTTSSNTTVSSNKCYGAKNGGNDDIYFVLEDTYGNRIEFCVERYVDYSIYGTTYEDYVEILDTLEVGDTVEIQGANYWWYGPNPHVIYIA